MSNVAIDDQYPRCEWAGTGDPLMLAYHDEEWGTPSRDPVHLFEMLTLEGAQAGLSWQTILRKREGYRRLFADFDVERVAAFDATDVERLMADAGIVRNRAKIESTIDNARGWLALVASGVDPVEHLWSFVGGAPIVNRFERLGDLPVETEQSRAMSRDLRRRGFRFVGPTICYALMEATGMVDDHTLNCFRRTAAGAREPA